MFVFVWLAVIIIPFIMMIVSRKHLEGTLVQMKEGRNGRALYIFPGMCSPSAEASFRQFADAYDGDVWFVQYAHSGCSMDVYCLQVYQHANTKYYAHVDILGISIGAQTYATLDKLFEEYRNYDSYYRLLFNIPVIEHAFWAICPFSPLTANYDVIDKATKAIPVARIVKIALGLVGQLPFIRWDGVWRSLSEIIEQGVVAASGKPLNPCVDLECKEYLWVHPEGAPSFNARRKIKGIVMAKKDALANNQRIETFYQATPLAYANGDHCDFKEHGDDYVTALRNLGLFE